MIIEILNFNRLTLITEQEFQQFWWTVHKYLAYNLD